jgi:hypothetical protein
VSLKVANLAGIRLSFDERGDLRRSRSRAGWEYAGAIERGGRCPMKNSQPECVGRVFVVVRSMRRCLICERMFTPKQTARPCLRPRAIRAPRVPNRMKIHLIRALHLFHG